MNAPIFRPEAVQRLSSPDNLDTLLRTTRPAGWLAAVGCAALSVAAVVWSFTGSLPAQLRWPCVMVAREPAQPVLTPAGGTLLWVGARTGETAAAGEVLARLRPMGAGAGAGAPDGAQGIDIVAPSAGKWINVSAQAGQSVAAGAPLAWLEGGGTGAPDALVLASLADGGRLRAGMTATVGIAGRSLGARVESVAGYPVPREQLASQVGHAALAAMLNPDPAVLPVRLRLEPAANGEASGQPLASGTLCQATITLRSDRPITRLLPFLAR